MTERCPGCGGRPTRADFVHRYPCDRERPPLPAPHRPVPRTDQVASVERVVADLLEQIRQHGLDAPARSSWPDDSVDADITPGERLISQQARIARRALRRLAPDHPLIDLLTRVLVPGFRAPSTIEPPGFHPPFAIWLALERLRAITPLHWPLARPRAGDTEDVSRDRRLVEWWAQQG